MYVHGMDGATPAGPIDALLDSPPGAKRATSAPLDQLLVERHAKHEHEMPCQVSRCLLARKARSAEHTLTEQQLRVTLLLVEKFVESERTKWCASAACTFMCPDQPSVSELSVSISG